MKMTTASLLLLLSVGICLGDYQAGYPYTSNQRVQYSSNNQLQTSGNEWAQYQYTIDEGTCRGDKLVNDDVQKEADPYTFKKTSYNWDGKGMYKISCIRVLNRMPRGKNAAEARISSGGVSQSQVRIEMRSQDSQKIDYHVEIWGESSQSHNNLALSTDSNKVLLFNGKSIPLVN